MKLVINKKKVLSDAHMVSLCYKTGEKFAMKFEGWEKLIEYLKHKKGPKPKFLNFYTKKGIYSLSHWL